MTSIFKRSEKSPSRPTSQAGSIIMESQNTDNNLINDDHHNNLITENVAKTLQDPIGRLLLNLASTSIALSKKSDIPAPNLDIEDISNDYQEHLQQNKKRIEKEIREEKLKLDHLIKNYTADKKFTTMETIVAPSKYSPTDILTHDEYKRNLAHNLFPKKQFNTKSPSSPSIAEHLTNLNEFQEDMCLSEAEFKRFLQKSFTNEPYQFISDQISSKLPISDIYSNLLKKYDTRINPFQARDKLLQYNPPPNSTLASIESDILELGNRAALIHDETSRNSCFNAEVISALKKALPRQCSEYVLKAEKECNAYYGRNASFAEFSTSLKVYSDLIDLELEKLYASKPMKSIHYSKYNTPRHSVNALNFDENRRSTYNNNNHAKSSYNNYKNNRHFINNLDIEDNYIFYNNGSNFSNYNRSYINSLDIGGTPQYSRNYSNNSNNNNKNHYNNQSSYINKKPQYNPGQSYQRNNNSNRNNINNYRNNNNYKNNNNINNASYSKQPHNQYKNGQYNPQNFSKRLRDQFFDNFGSHKYHHNKPVEEYKNKINCPLCGDSGHESTRCRQMRLDNGKLKVQPPTNVPCTICLKATKNEMKLLHPEHLCFRRPAFIQAKREGKHRDYDMRVVNQEYRNRIKSQ